MVMSLRPKTMQMKGVRAFPKWNRKVTSPTRGRIILRNLRPSEFTLEMDPQTPPNPKSRESPYRISMESPRAPREPYGAPISLVSPKVTRFRQAHSTDVPPSSLCPPRKWSGAGVGVGMLWGAGNSLTWNAKTTKLPSHVFDRYEIHIQDFEDLLWGSSSFSGSHLHTNW